MSRIPVRQILSGALVGFYGAAAGGYIGTATLWIFGILPGFAFGAVYGALLGSKTLLRDALILVCGGFGSVFALLWLALIIGIKSPVDIIATIVIFILSGVLHRLIQERLAFQTRYGLAWAAMAYLIGNVTLLFALRS